MLRRFLAVHRARWRVGWIGYVVLALAAARVYAQTGGGEERWNDARTLTLVDRATARRAAQLADTGLTDYHAIAHGYVTFLAQLGEGFRTPPKIIKADELEDEVYWHAPNLSKQHIVGRRDTLLLPTDIAYHSDHLGIVQNNFPNAIRIGDGDEVRDVPHPLSPLGLLDYDFALSDSFAIGTGTQRIQVYEVKVRPKDDTQPRVIGAVYLDQADADVVRMTLSFTRAAFLDNSLDELSVVLENRLVGGRFWLPSRQEIEIARTGTWMNFPARGIIRGRWEIGDYSFNTALPIAMFSGPEIVQAPPSQLKRFPWTGNVLDSLPPDVRAVTEADVQRVQDEARALVRARALARAQHPELAARNVSDLVRSDRVEGLAAGGGVSTTLGRGLSADGRARYGLDDRQVKGAASLTWTRGSGASIGVVATRDFREAGDGAERSRVVNSLASQEFGSDDTDPYLVRGGGIVVNVPEASGFGWRLEAGVEQQDSLSVHAHPVTGAFLPTLPVPGRRIARAALVLDRAPGLWWLGTELTARVEARGTADLRPTVSTFGERERLVTERVTMSASVERPFGIERFVSRTTAGGLWSSGFDPEQELLYFGGPTTAPGFDFHAISANAAVSEHVEWRLPIPFPAFSLGRFGRVPGTAMLAPYAHVVVAHPPACGNSGIVVPPSAQSIGSAIVTSAARSCAFTGAAQAAYPAVGAGLLSPFNLLRVDVARGFGPRGRWTFSFDVTRDLWSIL